MDPNTHFSGVFSRRSEALRKAISSIVFNRSSPTCAPLSSSLSVSSSMPTFCLKQALTYLCIENN